MRAISGLIGKLFDATFIRDSIKITGLSFVGKGVSLVIPFLIAFWFGTGSSMDEFFFSYGLILFFSMAFSSTVTSVIVPSIAEMRKKGGDIGRFIGSLFLLSAFGSICIALLFAFAVRPILLFATRFDERSVSLVVLLLLEMIPVVLSVTLSSILDGVLNAFGFFATPALTPALRSAGVILVVFLIRESLWIHSIVIGYCVGETIRFLVLFLRLKAAGLFHFRLRFYYDENIRKFLRLSFFQIIAVVLLGMGPVFDRGAATWLGSGSISILYYAERLYSLFFVFGTSGITVVLITRLSRIFYAETHKIFRRYVFSAAISVGVVSVVVNILLLAFSSQLVKLVFGAGSIEYDSLNPIQNAYVFYMIGFTPACISQVYARAQIVSRNTKAIMRCAALMLCLNVLLDIILMKPLAESGIALSTSIVNISGCLYLFISFMYGMSKACAAAGGVSPESDINLKRKLDMTDDR